MPMAVGAGARRRVGQRHALLLLVGDQVGERLHAELRIDHHHDRRPAQIGDVGEVLDRIVARIGIDDRRDHMRRDAGDHEGVAVGLHMGRLLRADDAAGARLVLDEELLLESLGQLFGDDAAKGIGAAARREGRDDLDRPRRPLLGGRRRDRQQEGADDAREGC